jgi:hypothetical protein
VKLTSVLVQQPGLLVDKPWKFSGYRTALTERDGWGLEATAFGALVHRDGGTWLVPWSRVMGCEVAQPPAAVVSEPLTASVAAVAAGAKGKR